METVGRDRSFSHAACELWHASFWPPLISKGNLRVPGTSPPNNLPRNPEGQQVLGSPSELPRGYQSYAERPNALVPAHSLQAREACVQQSPWKWLQRAQYGLDSELKFPRETFFLDVGESSLTSQRFRSCPVNMVRAILIISLMTSSCSHHARDMCFLRRGDFLNVDLFLIFLGFGAHEINACGKSTNYGEGESKFRLSQRPSAPASSWFSAHLPGLPSHSDRSYSEERLGTCKVH